MRTLAPSSAQGRLSHADLYAGTGCYGDGTPSTPMLVVQKAIKDDRFRHLVKAEFNDSDAKKVAKLRSSVMGIDGIETMPHASSFECRSVDEAMEAAYEVERPFPPTFSFLDPWGYRGLSVRLIRALTERWGCDCVFFFNYNRVNLNMNNPLVRDELNDVFGIDIASRLRGRLKGMTPEDREQCIVGEMESAITADGKRRTFKYKFKAEEADRTSHYLIFVSKMDVGIRIIRNIMSNVSSQRIQGVPTYEFDPRRADAPFQPSLLPVAGPLDRLQESLLHAFAGQTLSALDVIKRHDRIDDKYIDRNYKDALINLEHRGKIAVSPPAVGRPPRHSRPTFADHVVVTFPKKSS